MSDWLKVFGGVTGVLFIICLIIVGPFLSIWAMNTLFPMLMIPYTLKTWFAVILFGGIFRARNLNINNNK